MARGGQEQTGKASLFGALLRHWRTRKGLSQMALGLEAEVSSRHISFLETGRAAPGEQMILRLGKTLEIPPEEQNAMLRAAGFEARFEEPGLSKRIPKAIGVAIEHIKAQQEPFPLLVVDSAYDVLDGNQAMWRLIEYVAPHLLGRAGLNAVRIFFEDDAARGAVINWEATARGMVVRLQREVLDNPDDRRLKALLDEVLQARGVPKAWRTLDFEAVNEPVFVLGLRRGDVELRFVSAVTLFSAPQHRASQHIRLESYFPLDQTTRAVCQELAERS